MNAETQRAVFINRIELDAETLTALDQLAQAAIPDGRYWYDANCGAWGMEGGPTVSFMQAGLPLPGPMPPDISGGETGIFFNGRELHRQEQAYLMMTYGAAIPGRYLLNALGMLGTETGIPVGNLFASPAGTGSGSGIISGAGGFGMVDSEGVVFNMPDGSSYVG